MKKTITMLLTLIMLLSAVPAFADDVRTSGDFQYTIKGNGTATIVGYSGTGDVIIPQMLDGYTVAGIGDNAFYREKLSESTISVTVPETIKTIGDFAFWNMNVASINIPDAMEYIGKGAFVGCNECNFRISNNHPKYAVIEDALYDKSKKELIKGKEDTKVPEGIVSIGDYAFYGAGYIDIGTDYCKYWKDMSVLYYGADNWWIDKDSPENAYWPRTYLEYLPKSVESIGDYAFTNCEFGVALGGKKYVDGRHYFLIGENIQKIGDYAFCDVTFNASFGCDADFIIGDAVNEIGNGCFAGFSVGDKILIVGTENSNIEEIPERAFKNCKGKIACCANIEVVEDEAFAGCSFEYLNADHLEEIGERAFYQSKFSEYYFVFPSDCKSISKEAFAESNLYGIFLNDNIEEIGEKAFDLVDFKNDVYLPQSLTDIAIDAFPKYTQFSVEDGTYAYRWVDENAFNYTIEGQEQNLDWLNS